MHKCLKFPQVNGHITQFWLAIRGAELTNDESHPQYTEPRILQLNDSLQLGNIADSAAASTISSDQATIVVMFSCAE